MILDEYHCYNIQKNCRFNFIFASKWVMFCDLEVTIIYASWWRIFWDPIPKDPWYSKWLIFWDPISMISFIWFHRTKFRWPKQPRTHIDWKNFDINQDFLVFIIENIQRRIGLPGSPSALMIEVWSWESAHYSTMQAVEIDWAMIRI